jgi:hypothetical protein
MSTYPDLRRIGRRRACSISLRAHAPAGRESISASVSNLESLPAPYGEAPADKIYGPKKAVFDKSRTSRKGSTDRRGLPRFSNRGLDPPFPIRRRGTRMGGDASIPRAFSRSLLSRRRHVKKTRLISATPVSVCQVTAEFGPAGHEADNILDHRENEGGANAKEQHTVGGFQCAHQLPLRVQEQT